MAAKRTSFVVKIVLIVFLLIGLAVGWYGLSLYNQVYKSNVSVERMNGDFFFIPTGSTFEDVVQELYAQNVILDRASFEWVAERKNYRNHVKPGRYKVVGGMSNNDLVNLLRSGEQVQVKLRFNNIRTRAELAGKISHQIEADSSDILAMLRDPATISKYGFNQQTIISMFIPNTYEVYWNTSPEQFVKRMATEYKAFWNDSRKSQAKKMKMSQSEVATLASIVQKETYMPDERATIAGVYINRIKKGIPLQADPTLIFAIGDFTIKRVLNEHKQIDSPYNTYKYRGLPPGPICLPEISYLDAVLNFEKHEYLYFCAREDLSGYSNFAKSYNQHLVNARKYQREMNKRKIYR